MVVTVWDDALTSDLTIDDCDSLGWRTDVRSNDRWLWQFGMMHWCRVHSAPLSAQNWLRHKISVNLVVNIRWGTVKCMHDIVNSHARAYCHNHLSSDLTSMRHPKLSQPSIVRSDVSASSDTVTTIYRQIWRQSIIRGFTFGHNHADGKLQSLSTDAVATTQQLVMHTESEKSATLSLQWMRNSGR